MFLINSLQKLKHTHIQIRCHFILLLFTRSQHTSDGFMCLFTYKMLPLIYSHCCRRSVGEMLLKLSGDKYSQMHFDKLNLLQFFVQMNVFVPVSPKYENKDTNLYKYNFNLYLWQKDKHKFSAAIFRSNIKIL